METIVTYTLIALAAVTLLAAMAGLATFFSSITGGHPRTSYWSKIFAGVAYSSLGVSGLISVAYLESDKLLTGIVAALFVALGAWLLATGARMRRRALAEK